MSTVVAVVIGSSRRQPLILSSSAKDEPYYQWSQRPVSNRCIPVSTHRRSITNVDNFVIGTNNTSIIKKLISTARAVGVDGGSSYYFSSSSASSSASSSSSSSTSPELLPLSSISSSSFQESSQILNVSCLADEMRQEVRNYTKSWTGRPLKLVGIISQTHQDDEHDDSSSSDDDDECRTSRNDTKTYAERIAEACKEDGIEFELIQYRQPSPTTSFDYGGSDDDDRTTTTIHEVENIIHHVNQRHDVDGILIFYPIFKSQQHPQPQHQSNPQTNKFQSLTQQNSDSSSSSTIRGPYKNKSTGVYYMTYDDYLRDMVDPSKDVEGLSGDYHDRCSKLLPPVHPRTSTLDTTDGTTTAGDTTTSPAYSFLSKDDMILPCTALSIKHILDRHHHSTYDDGMSSESSPPSSSSSSSLPPRQLWTGQTVSVVNRSKILGRPLATMLASSGANVYSIDVDTILQFQQSGTKRLSPPRGDGDDDHQEEEHTKSPPPSPAVPAAATSKSTAHTESDAETSSTTTKTTEHNLEWCLRQSSVVVTAVPDPNFELPCHVIAPGTTVVNVSEFDNVKEEQVLKQPGIKYIPKVGQVTVAVLEQNLVRLHYQKHQAQNVNKT